MQGRSVVLDAAQPQVPACSSCSSSDFPSLVFQSCSHTVEAWNGSKSALFILSVLSSEVHQNGLTGRCCHRPSWRRPDMSRVSLELCLGKNREERIQRSRKLTDLPQKDRCDQGE